MVDEGEYQLITWSKDRTLRFWPVDPDMMQVRFELEPSWNVLYVYFILH